MRLVVRIADGILSLRVRNALIIMTTLVYYLLIIYNIEDDRQVEHKPDGHAEEYPGSARKASGQGILLAL